MRALVWLTWLPIRLIFALLMLPVIIVKFLIGAVFFLIVAPIAAVLVIAGLLLVAAVVLVPLAF
jgi:hypothetical protein